MTLAAALRAARDMGLTHYTVMVGGRSPRPFVEQLIQGGLLLHHHECIEGLHERDCVRCRTDEPCWFTEYRFDGFAIWNTVLDTGTVRLCFPCRKPEHRSHQP